jgi:hypothetical protein
MSDLSSVFMDSYAGFHFETESWYCDPDHYRKWLRQHQGEWTVNGIGASKEGQPIELWKWGRGERRIMAWTQMHGNEPTSSWAYLEILRFMEKQPVLFTSLKDKITLYFIPILNPDGARRFSRENAQGIDINRDFHDEKAIETRILKEQIQRIQPHLALNLHDQRSIFSVSELDRPAIMSFLSPSCDISRELNAVRRESMNLIGQLCNFLEPCIHGYIGRYTDEFYPNAFGDNLQALNIPTVLVESGSGASDPLRKKSRKLTAASILFLMETRAESNTVDDYFAIPENRKGLRDVIFRKVLVSGFESAMDVAFQASWTKADVGIQKEWKVDMLESHIDLQAWNERSFGGRIQLPALQKEQRLTSDLVELFELH